MEIEHLLHKLKRIEPKPELAARARARLLGSLSPRAPRLTWRDFILGVFQAGGALAFTAMLLAILAGGASVLPGLGWDKENLKAEAEAIDIQIQLTDVSYKELGEKIMTKTEKPKPKAAPAPAPAGTGDATTPSPNATETPMSVDEALSALSGM